MAVNKVIYGNNTIIDLTDSTVTPETLGEGVIAYNAKGERIVGDGTAILPITGTDLRVDAAGKKSAMLTADVPTEITHIGKNLLEHPYAFESNGSSTATSYSITYVKNADGSLHVSGTATGSSRVEFVAEATNKRKPIKKGTYTISGCPSGGSSTTYKLALTITGVKEYNDFGNGVTFTVEEDTTYCMIFRVYSGTTVDFDVKPQLEMNNSKTEWAAYTKEVINYTAGIVNVELHDGANHFSSATPFTILQYVDRNAGYSPEGVMELIETITLDADARVDRSQEPDGTPYAFKKVRVKIESPANTITGDHVYFYSQGDRIGRVWVTGVTNNTTNVAKNLLVCEPKDGYWAVGETGFITSGASDAAIKWEVFDDMYHMQRNVAEYPTIDRILIWQNHVAGTVIKIWGVRA